MSAPVLSAADRLYLEKSCADSGVPVRVTDPDVVLNAADLLRAVREYGAAVAEFEKHLDEVTA